MTKEQLQAENERLGKEVAALRTLLAAVTELADVPMAADPTIDRDWSAYLTLCCSRLGSLAAWADPDNSDGSPASAETLHTSARRLRQMAAVPLRYAPKPAPADEEWRLTPKGAEVAESWPPAVVTDAQLAAAIISVSDRVPIENLAPYALAKRLIAAMDGAAAVITDSERDCDERNPDGSGEPCHRGGDHGVHRDSNGDEWRTDPGPGGVLVGPFDDDDEPAKAAS